MPIERSLIEKVVEAPFGAHPTSCGPDYGFDLAHLKTYSAAAGEGWPGYVSEYVEGVDLAAYTDKVGGSASISKLPLPVF